MEDSGADIRTKLEALYSEIQATRMEGVPILNPALCVAAFGFEHFQEYHLGVLITPWFMNLVLVPRDQELFKQTAPGVGEKFSIALPVGRVEFIVGYEDAFGHSLSCSLFSPVFEFEDQTAAEETALAALAEVLDPAGGDGDEEDEDADMREIWEGRLPEVAAKAEPEPEPETPAQTKPKDVNRRDFLRGGTARDSQPDAADVQP